MHEKYMSLALEEAKRGMKHTHTNPLVGAILVKDQQIIGRGAHLLYGHEHAEKNAIITCQTPEKILNSTLYVTLEPCNHQGKQPACTQAILEAKIARVVVAQLDPNPLVSGKGIAFLEENGVEVISGVLTSEAEKLNPAYNLFHKKQRPYVTLKQAVSLDGKLGLDNQRTSLTGPEVYEFVRRERDNYQAILVGAQTAITDNPRLLGSETSLFPPQRIVLDRRGRVFDKPDLTLFKDESAPVIIFSAATPDNLPKHVTVLKPKDFSISTILSDIADFGIQSLYVEGGAEIHDQFLEASLWDELITYQAPILLGGNSKAAFSSQRQVLSKVILKDISIQQIGQDIRISARRDESCLLD